MLQIIGCPVVVETHASPDVEDNFRNSLLLRNRQSVRRSSRSEMSAAKGEKSRRRILSMRDRQWTFSEAPSGRGFFGTRMQPLRTGSVQRRDGFNPRGAWPLRLLSSLRRNG